MSEYIVKCKEFVSISGATMQFPEYIDMNQEIVRCRDCKWLDHRNLCLCMLPDGDGGYACWVVEPDGYCAWGERREQ